ncbi:MAG: glucose-1-phosphate cytidylyltransferase [Planctomycetaceae bacterium]|nr:glucose-1-phosphate cytidylyltransferase [Planctomycetaceae bacterium]
MKVVLLAGGYGTRISEESGTKPKPMVEIGGRPILWHIMKSYSQYGFQEFIICLGYKGYVIKEFFANYFLHQSDVTFDLQNNDIIVHDRQVEPWKVTLVDTGLDTMTGGRLLRIRDHLDEHEDFCMTYGDGVSDVNLADLIAFHRREGRLGTLTAVQPPGRFGALKLNQNGVEEFAEKPLGDGSWINGGFFVLSPKVLDYIEGSHTIWEQEPLQRLAADGELSAYKHSGFWQPMDTLRDKNHLDTLWTKNQAPWASWRSERKTFRVVKSPKAA